MITIKQHREQPDSAYTVGMGWYYGADHMRRIGRKDAAKLVGLYPLPEVGSEVVVAIKPDSLFTRRLYVKNISGHFYVASHDAPVIDWPEVFSVEVKE